MVLDGVFDGRILGMWGSQGWEHGSAGGGHGTHGQGGASEVRTPLTAVG